MKRKAILETGSFALVCVTLAYGSIATASEQFNLSSFPSAEDTAMRIYKQDRVRKHAAETACREEALRAEQERTECMMRELPFVLKRIEEASNNSVRWYVNEGDGELCTKTQEFLIGKGYKIAGSSSWLGDRHGRDKHYDISWQPIANPKAEFLSLDELRDRCEAYATDAQVARFNIDVHCEASAVWGDGSVGNPGKKQALTPMGGLVASLGNCQDLEASVLETVCKQQLKSHWEMESSCPIDIVEAPKDEPARIQNVMQIRADFMNGRFESKPWTVTFPVWLSAPIGSKPHDDCQLHEFAQGK